MSLTTRLFRAPAAVTKHSLRTFSSSLRQRSNASEGLLDILSGSKVAQSTKQSPIGNSLLGRTAAQAGLNERPTTTTQMIEQERRENFQKQIYRRWQTGDIYSPHDLTGAEQKKWKFGRKKPQSDAFDVLGINPVSEYKNFTIMSEYMTEMGRIKHSKDTGLRPKNQRKIAKAIRRAIGLGLMPSVHRHPLVLLKAKPSQFI
ncbi:hypothetical protein N0V91_010111 [Didymella pomorum]|uniref:Small ribosomal subunit protein bS18m n=1 Tax=Didymella pomorum TaxID=749634 RepID=A0A9W8Z5Z4_9PLEO|nr:hypothetical protein N0V91_010111 [Didymella pomorum]